MSFMMKDKIKVRSPPGARLRLARLLMASGGQVRLLPSGAGLTEGVYARARACVDTTHAQVDEESGLIVSLERQLGHDL